MGRKICLVSVLENTAREEDQEPLQHECAFARRKVRALRYALQRVELSRLVSSPSAGGETRVLQRLLVGNGKQLICIFL